MNKRYIYNPLQAAFMINEGCKPIKIDKHYRTNKIFWVFDKEDSQEVYVKWATSRR